VAVPARLELATFGLGNRCSIRLSYGTNKDKANLYHAGDRRAGGSLLAAPSAAAVT
jgi:hypothetical protein